MSLSCFFTKQLFLTSSRQSFDRYTLLVEKSHGALALDGPILLIDAGSMFLYLRSYSNCVVFGAHKA